MDTSEIIKQLLPQDYRIEETNEYTEGVIENHSTFKVSLYHRDKIILQRGVVLEKVEIVKGEAELKKDLCYKELFFDLLQNNEKYITMMLWSKQHA